MTLNDLKPSHIYYLAGMGNVIYSGLSSDKKLIMLRRILSPEHITYLSADQAKMIRMPLDKPKKLEADALHKELLLHIGDHLFFENANGIAFGVIKHLYNNCCDLTAKGITRQVSMRHLFTYDSYIDMQERLILRGALQGADYDNTELQVSDDRALHIS